MFLAFREEVEAALAEALRGHDFPTEDLGLEEPPAEFDAILASSVAFRLADRTGTAPAQIAAEIADSLETGACEYLGRCVSAGPYVNFHHTPRYVVDTVETAATAADFGALADTGTEVVVEHTSANPTGPIHVGRARNPIIGDALARLLDFAGHEVERHYYVNDAGRQIAVFTWAVERFDPADLPESARDRPDHDLVRYYRRGSQYLDEADPAEVDRAETEIRDILQGLERGDEATYERVSTVVDEVLEGMQATLDRLPAPFDRFVKETRFMRDGSTDDVIERLKGLAEAVFEDDAWQLDLSAQGFDSQLVFLRSDGTSLYTTRDLAHHEWKLSQFDEAVTVLGEDHKLQAEQLEAALDLLGNDTDRLRSVHYSWVTLPEGGMSTREGTGINLDDLLDEAIERARMEVEKRLETRLRDDELDESDVERIARQVGIGAVRYDIIATQPTKGITFEWDRALDFEAQSAPYVQYVHARCCGILAEAAKAGHEAPSAVEAADLPSPEERALVREVARFPAVIQSAASDLEPHQVATYTRRLATEFNAFYRECPVLDAEPGVRGARLALVAAARHTVRNALDVLGVEAPESM